MFHRAQNIFQILSNCSLKIWKRNLLALCATHCETWMSYRSGFGNTRLLHILDNMSSHSCMRVLLPEQSCWYAFTDITPKHYQSKLCLCFKNELSFGSRMGTLRTSWEICLISYFIYSGQIFIGKQSGFPKNQSREWHKISILLHC